MEGVFARDDGQGGGKLFSDAQLGREGDEEEVVVLVVVPEEENKGLEEAKSDVEI